jgi:glycosidase
MPDPTSVKEIDLTPISRRRAQFRAERPSDRPVPTELRDEDWYHRPGEIRDFDRAPENQNGDISSLKDYANDDDAIGSDVINALITAHCYWIREADVDCFRIDAVKHMGVSATAYDANIGELVEEYVSGMEFDSILSMVDLVKFWSLRYEG